MEKDKFDQYLYSLKEDLNKIKHKYTTNELWENFKSALELGVKKIVPVKTIRKKDKLPWVSKKIKQKIKQRNQAFSKMKKSNTNKFLELKSTVQREIRKNYNKYLEDIIDPETDKGNKKLWGMVKRLEKDSSNCSPWVKSKW